jgi:hypothetical protein
MLRVGRRARPADAQFDPPRRYKRRDYHSGRWGLDILSDFARGRTNLLPPLSSGGASLRSALAPFPYPGHRTGLADLAHPALG